MIRLGTLEIAQNDFLLVLDFVLLVLFGRYVWYRIVIEGLLEGPRLWEVMSRPATKVGWALFLTYASRWLDHLAFLCWVRNYPASSRLLWSGALVLSVWSSACIVRVLAGTAWGPKAWLWIIGFALVVSGVIFVFPKL